MRNSTVFVAGFHWGVGPINGTIRVHGNVSAWANLYNIVVTPLGQDNAFIPYFGAGQGFALSRASLHDINAGSVKIPVGLNSGDTDVAGDLLIGAEYRITS